MLFFLGLQYAANVPYGPQKGFNAHKHWLSGWFDDRAFDLGEEILTKGALGAPLVSFVDASNLFLPEGEAVILKLGDLYIQYNLAKSYNVGTYKDQEDRVTINYAESDEAVSDLVGALAENDVYIQPNFAGSGIDLIIQVCSVGADELGDIDYAVLSIHMDDGMHSSLCQDPNIAQHTWFDQRRGWMSESDSFPSVAPSFNEDFLEYEEEEPIVDIDGTGEPAPEVAEEPSAVRAPTPSPVAAVNKNVDDNLVVESEKSQPDEMNSVWGESADEEQQASPVSILMVVIIALSSMVIVGFVYLRFRGDTSAEPVEKSKGKPEELDTTETDLSDRSEEDDIIEVWVPSPTKSTLEVTQLCL